MPWTINQVFPILRTPSPCCTMIEHIEGTQFTRPEPPVVPDDILPAQVGQRQRLNNRLDALNKDIATGREQIRNMELASELYHLRQETKAFEHRRENLLEDISRSQLPRIFSEFATFMAILPFGLMLYEWVIARRKFKGRQHAREWTETQKEEDEESK
jgi:hypothetical protein